MNKLYAKDLARIASEQPVYEVFHCEINQLLFKRGTAYLLRRHPGLCAECDKFAKVERPS